MKVLVPLLLTASFLTAAPKLVEGNPSSQVKVLIYEDLACSDCADFRQMMDLKILPKYKATVAFEHRDFPLAKHKWARNAAIAARHFESVSQDLAIDWRRYALANLKAINVENLNEHLTKFAEAHKQDAAKAIASLTNDALAKQVEADFQDGVARGVSKTPTVFVNGQPFIETFTFEEISAAIEAALK